MVANQGEPAREPPARVPVLPDVGGGRGRCADFCLRSQRSYAMGAEISGLVDPDAPVSQGVNRLICCAPKKGPGKNSNSEYEVRYIA